MPGSELRELTQEDVFHYIDEERSKSRVTRYQDIPQKTRGSFKTIFIINLISILIATGGFFVVYSIFKQKEYQLVGNEKSIKGLEDVLYKELQKKANAELENKQKEIEAIRNKLSSVNNQMADFKNKQQQILHEKMRKLELEYQQKMKKEQSNKSAKEKAEIEKKYKALMENRKKQLETEAQKQEAEFQKRLQEERKKLESIANARTKELEQTQEKLKQNQEELKKQLEEEQRKGQTALRSVQAKLENKEKIETFNGQISTSFQSAIQAYKEGNYKKARSGLKSVLKLYENRPKEISVSPTKEAVDKFFVNAINDYLSIKKNNTEGNSEAFNKLNRSISKLSDLEKDLQSGYFLTRKQEYQKRFSEISNLLPEAIRLSTALSDYKLKIRENQTRPVITQAEQLYSAQKYPEASKLYFKIAQNLSTSPLQSEIIRKIADIQSLMTPIQAQPKINSNLIAINRKEINKKALKIYKKAKEDLKKKNWTQAEKSFAFVLTNYPMSDYTAPSLKQIIYIREQQATKDSFTRLQKLHTRKSARFYKLAENARKNKKWSTAVQNYQIILERYPYAKQGKSALKGLINTLSEKIKTETQALYANYSDNLNQITNRLISEWSESNRSLISDYQKSSDKLSETYTKLTNKLYLDFTKSNRTLLNTLNKITNELVQKYKKKLAIARVNTKDKIVKIGRVIESVETDLIITPLGSINIHSGDTIKIFRNVSGGTPEYIASAKVKEASKYVITAKIKEKFKFPKVGDLVYK